MKLKICICTTFAAVICMQGVQAQEKPSAYPTRPIKILIGFAPGGSTDAPMRVLAESASKILKQPILIESKPGAGGTLPAVVLQTSANDGYTLGIASLGIYRLPYITDIKWDPSKDLSYIIGLTGYAFGIVVPTASSIKTWGDFVSAAKAKPEQMTYGTPSVGSLRHGARIPQLQRFSAVCCRYHAAGKSDFGCAGLES